MWKMELHFVPVKGDREDKNFKEKKKQEDNKKKRGPEDKLRSKGLISTLALSSISCMDGGKISYLDSGASNHMTPDRYRFVDFALATRHIRIGKRRLEVKGKGTIIVKMTESCGWTLSLCRTLCGCLS